MRSRQSDPGSGEDRWRMKDLAEQIREEWSRLCGARIVACPEERESPLYWLCGFVRALVRWIFRGLSQIGVGIARS